MKRHYYSVDIEFAEVLAEMDGEDLLSELKKRGVDNSVDLMQIYESMHSGNKERAWDLMRQFVQEKTGRILP